MTHRSLLALLCPAAASHWGLPPCDQLGREAGGAGCRGEPPGTEQGTQWTGKVVCKRRLICTISNYFAVSAFYFLLIFRRCYFGETSISNLKKFSIVFHICLCKTSYLLGG